MPPGAMVSLGAQDQPRRRVPRRLQTLVVAAAIIATRFGRPASRGQLDFSHVARGPGSRPATAPAVAAATSPKRLHHALSQDAARLSRRGVVAFTASSSLAYGIADSADAAEQGDPVEVYFGQGCFWHVQHEITVRSLKLFKDAPPGAYGDRAFSPAVAGYAGGKLDPGDKRVCYNNGRGAPLYDQLGHAEVVRLKMPATAVEAMSRFYFDEASRSPGRHDPQDVGSAYRSAIGLPGGVRSAPFPAVQQANAGRLQLLEGVGGDPDTLGKGVVYIYDTAAFPFYPAEVYHQFHDDMTEKYPSSYKALQGKMLKAGVIASTGCPER